MEEVELKEFLKFYLKKIYLIIGVALISALIGMCYTKCITPKYESKATLILAKSNFETDADVSSYAKLVDRYHVIINSENVAKKVIKNLKLDMNLSEFYEVLEVESYPNSYCLKIYITHSNAESAAQIANEVAKVSIETINEIYKDKDVKVLDNAEKIEEPININMLKNVLIFTLGGVFIICVILFFCFIFDGNKKDENSEIEK